MSNILDVYKEALINLEKSISDPDIILEPQKEQLVHFKKLTKSFYNLSMQLQNGHITNTKALPKLLIDGFDEEQIWQQLELNNIPVLKYHQKSVNEFNPETFADICVKNNSVKEDIPLHESDDENTSEDGYAFDDDSEDDISNFRTSEQLRVPDKGAIKKQNKKSIIDDQFFKQSQLEEFLTIEDLKFEKETEGNPVTDDSEEIDWEKNYSDESDTEFEKNPSTELMYADFFDPPEESYDYDVAKDDIDIDSVDEDEISHSDVGKEYDTRDYESGKESDEEKEIDDVGSSPKRKQLFDDDDDPSSQNENTAKVDEKTVFQKQQDKQQKRIKEMEEKLLQPKPWQLTGEVDASRRPQNSLMKQPTTFDVNAKQNIELTEDLTLKIEEIIRMAISNKAWEDVERKVKPKEITAPYKKLEPLDQTKSKKGLAEVYEDDYLKLKNKFEDVEDPRHTEILKLMDQLTPELYALFSHIPKPPVPEIKVVNNMPAITVEEVAPVGLSDAALLAPEEVKKKPKGDVKSDAEKSTTDKKRERRKKKILQKLREKKNEEKLIKLAASNPGLAKKQEKLLALKKLKQSKNAIIVNSNNSKKIKSSKDFFARLDETVNKKFAKLKH